MGFLAEMILHYYELIKWSDPRLAHLPFMGSPLPVLAILTTYIVFVFKIGPKIMKNRKAFELRKTIIGYNILQICANLVGVFWATSWLPYVNFMCTPLNKPNITMCHYFYFILKFIDLFDTIFFTLRKKEKQITFLHLYHHILMFFGVWATCKYIPGGQVFFLGIINTGVHVVMYFYYLLTAWDSQYKKSIWWKQHLTELQIVQHCTVFLAFLAAAINSNCDYPKLLLWTYLLANIVMIYLFTQFYIKAYRIKKTEDKE